MLLSFEEHERRLQDRRRRLAVAGIWRLLLDDLKKATDRSTAHFCREYGLDQTALNHCMAGRRVPSQEFIDNVMGALMDAYCNAGMTMPLVHISVEKPLEESMD